MKKIDAFEAEDGTKFFSEDECLAHEKTKGFEIWYRKNGLVGEPSWAQVRNWLLTNAEYIRGFLPPVATKSELDIDLLKQFSHRRVDYINNVRAVDISKVEQWLAGEFK